MSGELEAEFVREFKDPNHEKGPVTDLESLNVAIRDLEQVVDATPMHSQALVEHLKALRSLVSRLYNMTYYEGGLEKLLELSLQILTTLPEGTHDHEVDLYTTAFILMALHIRTWNLEYLEESLIMLSHARKGEEPANSSELSNDLKNLSLEVERHDPSTNVKRNMEIAVKVLRQCINLTAGRDPLFLRWLDLLYFLLDKLLYYTPGGNDRVPIHQESIRVLYDLANLEILRGDFQIEKLLKIMGHLECLLKDTGDPRFNEEAMAVSGRLLKIIPTTHPQYLTVVYNRGTAYLRQFESTAHVQDALQAIELFRNVIKIPREDSIIYRTAMLNLGIALVWLSKRTVNADLLDEALPILQRAVELEGRGSERVRWTTNIIECLMESGKEAEAIDTAMKVLQSESCPVEIYTMLVTAYGCLYDKTSRLEELNRAIEIGRQGLNALSQELLQHLMFRGTLAAQLLRRYTRSHQLADLEEAIYISRKVIKNVPKGLFSRCKALINLATMLRMRYMCLRNIKDLQESIELQTEVLDTIPYDHPARPNYLRMLSDHIYTRYKDLGDDKDRSRAFALSHEALESVVFDSPYFAHCHFHHCNLLAQCNPPPWSEISSLLSRSWRSPTILPGLQLRMAAMLRDTRRMEKDFDGAYAAAAESIRILRRINPSSLAMGDSQYLIKQYRALGSEACELALRVGKSGTEALQLLERGRAIIIGNLMGTKRDEKELREAHPTLCTEYERLRLAINRAGQGLGLDEIMTNGNSPNQANSIAKFESLVSRIQELPGFENFQKGLTEKQLRTAAGQGTIVAINFNAWRSDAIALSSNGVKVIALTDLNVDTANGWIMKLVDSSGGPSNKEYMELLRWLWQDCVEPILRALDFRPQDSPEDLPRVWWIASGGFTLFPFHAAGDRSRGPTANTLSYVLSSYTSSINTLLEMRKRSPSHLASNSGSPAKLLLVSMPTTPGAADLEGVEQEVAAIKTVLGSSIRMEKLLQPDVDTVMQHLPHSQIVHFACHGVADPINPADSGLLLQTAFATPEQQVLTARAIFESHNVQGQIAYLSACSTAEARVAGLLDEHLHVVSSFQVAGFRHVVGCLWPSDDAVCVEVAVSFYSQLHRSGMQALTDRDVALALHKAVKAISEHKKYEKRPLRWAQYVHYGA
ncbi:CHAT domain-containing tetratricopeptide repeat protein [Aspergillus luchuensis]|uniref:Uncharacterized protein n=2 Tax=Aspergillus kawachii TaxID=1069201 RepID=A0A7R7WZZ7_ASPKA|nr:uncharacterized protein AKAW2_50903S [Aspergillus luchuensis]OJZ82859.1 hypothetical protein ASPFODRAFT_142555 [Aspergillus luchuensis CBS 106.47]BCS00562.1 hypothetical protein AKAW2_50903S [Aspergillus luchuensis]BCS12331.1 hypothetical protein ALUC_50377S [Aspergillus luchuensis]GAA91212.1 hypothetical protein AKAW_09326 [Aspergillus luchuensis IFO 4308]